MGKRNELEGVGMKIVRAVEAAYIPDPVALEGLIADENEMKCTQPSAIGAHAAHRAAHTQEEANHQHHTSALRSHYRVKSSHTEAQTTLLRL